jgi:hypothetical protein
MPPEKRIKLETRRDNNNYNELEDFRSEIKKISKQSYPITITNEESIKSPHTHEIYTEIIRDVEVPESDHIKRFVRDQIKLSERRIHTRFLIAFPNNSLISFSK